MFRAGVRNRLRAIHALPAEGGSEALPHSHDYVIEWSCATGALNEKGYAVDISALKRCLGQVCRAMEGADLNALPFFSARAPSLENLAVFVTAELRRLLGEGAAGIARSGLTIWESDDAWASYEEPWAGR
jgi:6-pyruvoyltetrahydropterin/6-carboxytetrahydropterin synthase